MDHGNIVGVATSFVVIEAGGKFTSLSRREGDDPVIQNIADLAASEPVGIRAGTADIDFDNFTDFTTVDIDWSGSTNNLGVIYKVFG